MTRWKIEVGGQTCQNWQGVKRATRMNTHWMRMANFNLLQEAKLAEIGKIRLLNGLLINCFHPPPLISHCFGNSLEGAATLSCPMWTG